MDEEEEFDQEPLAKSETMPVMIPILGLPAGPMLIVGLIAAGIATQFHTAFWGAVILITGGSVLRVIAYNDPWALRIVGIWTATAGRMRRAAKLFGGCSLDPLPIRAQPRRRRIRDAL
jgi:type IV secretory pathway VirB3-like protein